MNADDVVALERVTRVTPFGARFWDAATRRFIADRLRLRAWRGADTSTRATEGFPNPSGVMLLAGLPGLRELENGAGDDAYWAAAPVSPPHRYRVEFSDRAGRFLPYTFDAHLPWHGLYPAPYPDIVSPALLDAFPLFSAPARPVPPALAAVRAQLRRSDDGRPAAWALVETFWNGTLLCTGLADREGRVSLYFAYPEPVPKHLQRVSPSQPYPEASWTLTMQVRHTPYAQDVTPPAVERLERILAQEPRALLDSLMPAANFTDRTLELGVELVVRSDPSSYLYVQVP